MTTLYLVRHGHTVVADANVVAGFNDVELSELGEQQIVSLSPAVATLQYPGFYCSDLQRSIRSAELMGATSCIQDARLRELNFGDWEGLEWDEVHQQDTETLQRWSENWVDLAPPGGETFTELAERTGDWLTQTISKPAAQQHVVVAHGGSIRALLCHALDLPLNSAMKFSINHAHVTCLKFSTHGNRCEFLNKISFDD